MKLHWKAGVPALVFTAVFLLLPGFRAGWPGVWAVASLCIWLPAYVWDERHSPRCKAAVSLLPVSYTHLDVYKRQDSINVNLLYQFM